MSVLLLATLNFAGTFVYVILASEAPVYATPYWFFTLTKPLIVFASIVAPIFPVTLNVFAVASSTVAALGAILETTISFLTLVPALFLITTSRVSVFEPYVVVDSEAKIVLLLLSLAFTLNLLVPSA